jgi:ribosomal protein S18 acetylase RimI-like enzyme
MIEIRPLEVGDKIEDLITLSREFFAEYESHHTDFFDIDTLQDSEIIAYFSRSLEDDDGATYLALTEGRVVGYITIHVRPQPSYWKVKMVGGISGLMVQKRYRRRGIAGQLLASARRFFQEKGVRYYTVFTAAENLGALEFYNQCGMSPIYTTMIGQAELA